MSSQEGEEIVDFEFSTETSEDGTGFAYIEWEATDLEPAPGEGRRPTNMPEISPFVDARVRPATNDHVGVELPDSAHYAAQVPIWVSADLREDRSSSESAAIRREKQSELISKIIRRRGYPDGVDQGTFDAGHLVALSLRGDYVDFNLFPQERHLNRGNKLMEGTSSCWHYWRGVEALILEYLRTEKRSPRVELQVRLWYDNPTIQDLPTRIRYSVRFYRSAGEQSEETEEILQGMRTLLNSAVASEQIANAKDCKEFYDKARQTILPNQKMGAKSSIAIRSIIIISSLCAMTVLGSGLWQMNKTPPLTARERGLSVWDFVPLVGTYRTFKEGFEDIADGKSIKGGLKLGLGAFSAAADLTMTGGVFGIARDAMAKRVLICVPQRSAELIAIETAGWIGDGVFKQFTKEGTKMAVGPFGRMLGFSEK